MDASRPPGAAASAGALRLNRSRKRRICGGDEGRPVNQAPQREATPAFYVTVTRRRRLAGFSFRMAAENATSSSEGNEQSEMFAEHLSRFH